MNILGDLAELGRPQEYDGALQKRPSLWRPMPEPGRRRGANVIDESMGMEDGRRTLWVGGTQEGRVRGGSRNN